MFAAAELFQTVSAGAQGMGSGKAVIQPVVENRGVIKKPAHKKEKPR